MTADGKTGIIIRSAARSDLPAITAMLSDDPIARERERASGDTASGYARAFEAITADARNDLLVAEADGRIIACLQLTFIPGLTYKGGERAQIEGVRVAAGTHGAGVGRVILQHAIGLAKARGCVLVQLTTDKRRPEALKVYQALGFSDSHHGLKLWL